MPIYSIDAISPKLPADQRYWIAPNSHIIGNVILEEDVGVWFGAVIRGDNEPIQIGARSNIQEGAMLHTDPGFPIKIGTGCTIGHHAIIHGTVMGNNCLIGMGATLLNGVQLSNNCLVGANALVTEGRHFGDNCLIVGSPAKAIRTLDESAVAQLQLSASHYVENYRRFKQRLVRIDP